MKWRHEPSAYLEGEIYTQRKAVCEQVQDRSMVLCDLNEVSKQHLQKMWSEGWLASTSRRYLFLGHGERTLCLSSVRWEPLEMFEHSCGIIWLTVKGSTLATVWGIDRWVRGGMGGWWVWKREVNLYCRILDKTLRIWNRMVIMRVKLRVKGT